MADGLGLSALAWGVLESGLLTAKHLDGEVEDARVSDLSERARGLVEAFVEHARGLDATPIQLAVAWVLAAPFAGGPIPILGARSVAQLDGQLAALEFEVDPAVWQEVGTVKDFDLGFPRGFLESDNVRDLIFGDTHELLVR